MLLLQDHGEVRGFSPPAAAKIGILTKEGRQSASSPFRDVFSFGPSYTVHPFASRCLTSQRLLPATALEAISPHPCLDLRTEQGDPISSSGALLLYRIIKFRQNSLARILTSTWPPNIKA
ncbi:hypothetical protein CPSG_07624 [Coccidioides posadasii str. Silveira]|uniref:Uncharacterized protein n=1 Tax=Coccidioides posadasii (strain RMSCC 757 / Silveira) TaxID=443226 RepID=E9DCS2_COCPS|nr:hypothetical protein CPSG_07624 [Coccidioides posadasii str. Silveira]